MLTAAMTPLSKNLGIQTALALSAASALVYEVAATKVLFFYFIESSYSLATVLSVFLFGLGVGSFLVYKFSERIRNKKLLFGILQLLIGLYAFFILTNLLNIIPQISPLGTFAVSSLILLVPTIFLGAIFPLAGSLFVRKKKDIIGLVYSVDLFGAIAGALVAGFFLIPTWGITIAVLVGAGLNFLSAFIVLPGRTKIVVPLTIVIIELFVMGGVIQPISGSVVSSAAERGNNEQLQNVGIQFSAHSPYGTVKVQDYELFIDERKQCGFLWGEGATESDMSYYAIEPIKNSNETLHTLNIGLGCGVTLSRALTYPSVKADVVEINPMVVEANKMFSGVLRNERVYLVLDEGLNYLRDVKKKYHSLLVDIEDPTVAYSSSLYTVEAFKIISNALALNGTFALWNYEKKTSDTYQSLRYFDILYYSLKEAFLFVYQYPGIFLASKKKLDREEYIPQGPYEINTLDRNTLTAAFFEES